MSDQTTISWTDHTFNIVWGCAKVSPGCKHCYAEQIALRYAGKESKLWRGERATSSAAYWRKPLTWNRRAEKKGQPARVFCSSMSDVFEDHPTVAAEREKLWPLMRSTPWLDWQLLTKRPENIAAALPPDWDEGYPNVWLGTSVESREYEWRAWKLALVPAVIRFLSIEPLIEEVDPEVVYFADWVIVGGESGKGFRPMDPYWAYRIQYECGAKGIPFFMKQQADRYPGRTDKLPPHLVVRQFPQTNTERGAIAPISPVAMELESR